MKTFEDVEVYKLSKEICLSVFRLSNEKFNKNYGFKDQIQRAAVSVMNNIAEGFERETRKEFIRFLYYSKGSVGEVRSMLNIAVELGYLAHDEYEELKSKCENVSKQLSNFIKYLKEKDSN
jgi:four helix bundle protein